MRIILDAFGGDNAPFEIVEGAKLALVKDRSLEIILCGNKAKLEELFALQEQRITIYDCKEIIEGEDDPIWAVRNKKDSSMMVGLNLLKEGKGDIFISAGNTGALFTGANLIIKRIKGVKRAGLGTLLPSQKGPKLLFDAGANVTLSSENLTKLAVMGAIYYESVTGTENATVGLINIGAEETKGTENLVEAYKLLKEQNTVNFKGNCEARDILAGDFDVMVCEGFTGNIVLKTIEGVAKAFMSEIKGIFMANIISKISSLGVKKGLYKFKKKFDYKEYGATPIIGLKMPVMKAHGSSDRKAIMNAILNSRAYAESKVIDKITMAVSKDAETEE